MSDVSRTSFYLVFHVFPVTGPWSTEGRFVRKSPHLRSCVVDEGTVIVPRFAECMLGYVQQYAVRVCWDVIFIKGWCPETLSLILLSF